MVPFLSLDCHHGVQRMNQLREGLLTLSCVTWKIKLDKVLIWGENQTFVFKVLKVTMFFICFVHKNEIGLCYVRADRYLWNDTCKSQVSPTLCIVVKNTKNWHKVMSYNCGVGFTLVCFCSLSVTSSLSESWFVPTLYDVLPCSVRKRAILNSVDLTGWRKVGHQGKNDLEQWAVLGYCDFRVLRVWLTFFPGYRLPSWSASWNAPWLCSAAAAEAGLSYKIAPLPLCHANYNSSKVQRTFLAYAWYVGVTSPLSLFSQHTQNCLVGVHWHVFCTLQNGVP